MRYIQPGFAEGNFEAFSAVHIITLVIILLLCMLLYFFRNFLRSRLFRYVLADLLLFSELSYQVWLLAFHKWTLENGLPLQLSDLTVLLAAAMLLSKNRILFQFLFFAGIASSAQALLTPDLGSYHFPHYRYFEFFLSHGGVLLACLYMMFSEKLLPSLQYLWYSILAVSLYAFCLFFLNKWLQTNFLYLMKKPEGASLLDVLGPWPWYWISAEAVMIASYFVLYGFSALFQKTEKLP